MEYKRYCRAWCYDRCIGGRKAGTFLPAQCGDCDLSSDYVYAYLWLEEHSCSICLCWGRMSDMAVTTMGFYVSLYLAASGLAYHVIQKTEFHVVLEHFFRSVWSLLWWFVFYCIYFYQWHPHGSYLVDRRNSI